MSLGRKWVVIWLYLLLLCAWAYGAKPKVLFVNSYHAEYEWSAGIIEGLFSELGITPLAGGALDDQQSPVELELFHMDTKRNADEAFIKSAALAARNKIEAWDPDVVIVADDNAFRSLVVPYYRNSQRPFVFCGVNWDVSHYAGAPFANMTGMIEVALFKPLIEYLQACAQGPRIGFLAGNRYSDRVEAEYGRTLLNIEFEREYYAESFEEWKTAFRCLQDEVDLFIWTSIGGIDDWDEQAAKELIRKEARIPFGTVNDWMMPYELIGVTKYPQEQGQWAAQAALQILDGTAPADIPVRTNKKARVHLNMALAKTMGLKFPVEWIENAHLISARPKKLLYVDSYHQGYRWSDDLEQGLRKALGFQRQEDGSYDDSRASVEMRVCRLNSKRKHAVTQIERAARQARRVVESWQPDVVVASDDNAAKYLIEPYYSGSDLPVVFCGLNWDASQYGFPTNNVTGMLERSPYAAMLERLSVFAQGGRIGIIGTKRFTHEKEVFYAKSVVGVQDADIKLVGGFAEWKEAYVALQKTVDMMIVFPCDGIDGWNPGLAEAFVMAHTSKPTGTVVDANVWLVLLGEVKIAEEQGWWAGRTALKILDGTPPSAIPVTENKRFRLYLNMQLARQMGIRFPVEWIQQATFVEE